MDIKEKTPEELRECIAAQLKYCNDKKIPHFAPSDGRCYRCNRNIYQNYPHNKSTGYDGTQLVTGCPHCYRSYCD